MNVLTKEEIEKRLLKIIEDKLSVEPEKITLKADFIDDLSADSLDLVELIMAIEEDFDTEIPDNDAEKIRNLGDAIAYLEEKI